MTIATCERHTLLCRSTGMAGLQCDLRKSYTHRYKVVGKQGVLCFVLKKGQLAQLEYKIVAWRFSQQKPATEHWCERATPHKTIFFEVGARAGDSPECVPFQIIYSKEHTRHTCRVVVLKLGTIRHHVLL